MQDEHKTEQPEDHDGEPHELTDEELDEVAGGGPVIEYEGDFQP